MSLYLAAAALTIAALGFVAVTGYLFALGEQTADSRVRKLLSLTGIALAVTGTGIAYMAFHIAYTTSPLPQTNPIGGATVLLWTAAWFASVIALTANPERLWEARLEALK